MFFFVRGLKDIIRGFKCRYTGRFSATDRDSFFKQLFSCAEVLACLGAAKAPLQTVEVKELNCSVLSMDFFDHLTDSGKLALLLSVTGMLYI